MFDLNGITFNVMQILDPVTYPGAEYFNFFFSLIAIWALFCFGLNVLVRIISRS